MKFDDALKAAVVQRGSPPADSRNGVHSFRAGASPMGQGVKVVKAQEMNDAPWSRIKDPKKLLDLSAARKGVTKLDNNARTKIPRTNGAPFRNTRHSDSRPLRRNQRKNHPKSGPNNSISVARFVEEHRREIGRFGSKALDKKDRRAYETNDLIRLGCRPPKRQKMAIGILQQKRKKEKEDLKRKKQMDLESGMLVRSRRRK